MPKVHLDSREVVRVSGEDARKLLNDTLTSRFDEGLVGAGRWFALLSPQGKIQVEGLVTEGQGAFWFDIDASLVADFVRRMKLYRLRAKLEIETPSAAIFWTPNAEAPEDGAIIYRDERAPTAGVREIVPGKHEGAPEPEALAAYHGARIGAGIAEAITDFAVNEVFPHDIGMDFLGGLDFKKGCYVGQEVVSRMQHRGTARRRPVVVSGVPDGAAAGAPLLVGEREAGSIGAPTDGKAVGIVRLDRLGDDVEAQIGGLPVKLKLPDWATYRFGESPTEV